MGARKKIERRGRRRASLPVCDNPNAFALWLHKTAMTVESAGKLLGVTTPTIYGWRRGNKAPSRTRAVQIERLSGGRVKVESWEQ